MDVDGGTFSPWSAGDVIDGGGVAKPETDAMDELLKEILEDLQKEITDDLNADILSSKLKNAYMEVKDARGYPDDYKEAAVEKDMKRYYSTIRNLALYDYNQVGAEGQASHSENGTSRTWRDRNEYLKRVTPIATCV